MFGTDHTHYQILCKGFIMFTYYRLKLYQFNCVAMWSNTILNTRSLHSYALMYWLCQSSGEQYDLPNGNLWRPGCTGTILPADWLAAIKTCGDIRMCGTFYHHSQKSLVDICSRKASLGVLLWGGDRLWGCSLLLHLQVWLHSTQNFVSFRKCDINTPYSMVDVNK